MDKPDARPNNPNRMIDRRRLLQYGTAALPLAALASRGLGLTGAMSAASPLAAVEHIVRPETSSETTIRAEWIGGY